MSMVRSSSRGSNEATSGLKLPEDNFDNMGYFLKVIKMEKYGEILEANGIKTIAQLKSKKEKFDELGIPLSDQVKIVKKFREMGL